MHSKCRNSYPGLANHNQTTHNHPTRVVCAIHKTLTRCQHQTIHNHSTRVVCAIHKTLTKVQTSVRESTDSLIWMQLMRGLNAFIQLESLYQLLPGSGSTTNNASLHCDNIPSVTSVAPKLSNVTQMKSTHTLDHNRTSAHSSIMRELNILRNDISTLKSMRSSSPHPSLDKSHSTVVLCI